MNAGGLLASMIGGAAQNGLTSANKISAENREHEKKQGLLNDANTRQDDLLKNANERDDQKTLDDRAWQEKRDAINHTRNMQLANRKSKTSGSSKSPWAFKEVTDESGNKIAGRYNSTTNVFEPLGTSTPPPGDNTKVLEGLQGNGLYNNESDKPKTIASLKELEQNQQASEIATSATAIQPSGNPGWKNEAEAKMVEEGAKIILQGGTPQRAQLGIMLRYDLPPEIKEKVEKLFYSK